MLEGLVRNDVAEKMVGGKFCQAKCGGVESLLVGGAE
jgi:hypothetical protein